LGLQHFLSSVFVPSQKNDKWEQGAFYYLLHAITFLKA